MLTSIVLYKGGVSILNFGCKTKKLKNWEGKILIFKKL
jgi:uncharacterized protein YybS (DUF2232 family)